MHGHCVPPLFEELSTPALFPFSLSVLLSLGKCRAAAAFLRSDVRKTGRVAVELTNRLSPQPLAFEVFNKEQTLKSEEEVDADNDVHRHSSSPVNRSRLCRNVDSNGAQPRLRV